MERNMVILTFFEFFSLICSIIALLYTHHTQWNENDWTFEFKIRSTIGGFEIVSPH